MYIFGGSNGEVPLGDMFAFNFNTKNWTKIMGKGDVPSAREGHSFVSLLDKYIFLFGGWNGKTIYNDCFLFDCDAKTWSKIDNKNSDELEDEPSPRDSHSTVLINDSIYVFGG